MVFFIIFLIVFQMRKNNYYGILNMLNKNSHLVKNKVIE